ncbi:MAG: hypothetical protein Q9165_006424 [Trypethelium subeluteriae]
MIDQEAPSAFIHAIKDNRNDYAARHGYGTFFPNVTDYNLENAPLSWSKVPAMRHAMTLYPHSAYFFYLSSFALIMNPSISIEAHIMNRERLETTMLVEKPVVPPDSIIKTFPNIRGDKIDLVLTQDKEGLSQDSFVIRRGEWAKYFLDAWFDPLYRSYNFQKGERHALEHIVQWHGTILAKLALVPQRILNSYLRDPDGGTEGAYAEGDFVVNFFGCDIAGDRNCEEEMTPMITRWREIRDRQHQGDRSVTRAIKQRQVAIVDTRQDLLKPRERIASLACEVLNAHAACLDIGIRTLEQTIHGSVARGTRAQAEHLNTVAEGICGKSL